MAFLQAGRVRLEYFDSGQSGTVMVLIHGASSSARIWHTVQARLAEDRVRSIAICMRGAGGSDSTPSSDAYNPAAYARDIVAALKTLDLKTFVLIGHSLGVATALNFMSEHALEFDVQALVLIAGGDAKGRPSLTPDQVCEIEANLSSPPSEDEATRRALWEPNHLGLPADVRDELWQDIQSNPKERTIGQRIGERPDMTEVLAGLTIPTLVMSGDADRTVALESTLRGYLSLPIEHRHLHIFHGISHFPNAQVPEEVARVLHSFVDALVPELKNTSMRAS